MQKAPFISRIGWLRLAFPLHGVHPALRIMLALLPTALLLVERGRILPLFSQTPAALHYPAVMLATWLGGLWPALLSITACFTYTLFVIRPHLLVDVGSDTPGLIRVIMFLTTSIFFVLLMTSLQAALRRASRAITLRDEFLSLASHELRTPLTAMKLQTDLFRRVHPPESYGPSTFKDLQSLVENYDRQLSKLDRLVNNLLDIAQLEVGSFALSRTKVDLAEMAADVIRGFAPLAQHSQSEITLEAPSPVVGEWDELRMEQILTNLISNSLKYGAGKPIRVTVKQMGTNAHLTVQDFGIGVAEKDQKRIFGRYERAVPFSEIQGLGLGLYLTSRIVDAHGGRIDLESTRGTGSRFQVTLPVKP